jgi:hypothetical protein
MQGGFMAVDRITLTANLPVAIAGLDELQLAQEGDVYTWDESAAQYVPGDRWSVWSHLTRLAQAISTCSFTVMAHPSGTKQIPESVSRKIHCLQ